MANTKISALTSATTPVAGTEVLPIVQSSATKQVSIANLTAGRSVSGTSFVVTGSTAPANGIYLPAANTVGIAVNSTNAVTIDSSFNVGIGTTSPGTRLDVQASSTTGYSNLNLYNSSASYAGSFCRFLINSASSGGYEFLRMFTATGEVLRISGNGNVTNTNGSYGTLSDVKLKENIVDATPKLNNLMQVRVVNYNLKDSPEQKQIGVVAQELEQVFPSLVYELRDTDENGENVGTTTKSVKYSVFVPMLIKAIQEQQILITNLTERIVALEGAK